MDDKAERKAMNIFPYSELHEIKYKNGVWTCPECGRKVQVEPFKIIVKGNQSAVHQGSVGGLRMDVTVKTNNS